MPNIQNQNYGAPKMPEQNDPVKNVDFDPNFTVETEQDSNTQQSASDDSVMQNQQISKISDLNIASSPRSTSETESTKTYFPILTVILVVINILIYAWLVFFVPYKEVTLNGILSCARKTVPSAFDQSSEAEYQSCKAIISEEEVCRYIPNEERIAANRSKIINSCIEGRDKVSIDWGTTPDQLADPIKLITLFTSLFLHGSWSHVLGNMLFLLLAGCYVECKLGKKKFLVVYFLSGIIGDFVFACFNSDLFVPLIGASGAIMGLLGANLAINGIQTLKIARVNLFGFQSYGLANWFIILMMIMQIGNLILFGKLSTVAYLVHIVSFIVGLLYIIAINKLGYLEEFKEKNVNNSQNPAINSSETL